jgi:hypothetical protein
MAPSPCGTTGRDHVVSRNRLLAGNGLNSGGGAEGGPPDPRPRCSVRVYANLSHPGVRLGCRPKPWGWRPAPGRSNSMADPESDAESDAVAGCSRGAAGAAPGRAGRAFVRLTEAGWRVLADLDCGDARENWLAGSRDPAGALLWCQGWRRRRGIVSASWSRTASSWVTSVSVLAAVSCRRKPTSRRGTPG